MNWTDWRQIATMLGGLALAASLSAAPSWWARAFAVGAGAFFAILFTEPVVHYFQLEPGIYQNAITGALALSGDRLARRALALVDTLTLPWGKS